MEVYTKDYKFKEKSIKKAVESMVDAAFAQLYAHGIKDDKVAWMIYKWRIDFMDEFYNMDYDAITVHTTPSGVNRFFSYRQFIVEASGKSIIKATCEIIYVDKSSMRPIRTNDFGDDFQKLFDDEDLELEEYDGKANISRFCIKKEYIDSYHHVNNAVYIDEIIKILNQDIKSIRLKYVKQCLLGEEVKIAYEINDGEANFRFFSKDETKLYASLKY